MTNFYTWNISMPAKIQYDQHSLCSRYFSYYKINLWYRQMSHLPHVCICRLSGSGLYTNFSETFSSSVCGHALNQCIITFNKTLDKAITSRKIQLNRLTHIISMKDYSVPSSNPNPTSDWLFYPDKYSLSLIFLIHSLTFGPLSTAFLMRHKRLNAVASLQPHGGGSLPSIKWLICRNIVSSREINAHILYAV